ncbi:MAG: TraB/GumN family protein [Campylobacteraceae bacterium]|jgi:uncharacterized protein YbaP (TraB family)|nr:TraB/GumN family protein [Campylobacteraceae bacterium]
MQKLLFVLSLTVLTAIFAFAQSSVWKITKGKNSIYIGGSVHALRMQDYPLPKEFDKAFEMSNITVFEANISEVNDPAFMQKIVQFMMLPNNKTLETVLNEKTYKLLEAKCKEIGIPIELMKNLTPFAITNMLMIIQMQKMDFTPQGVDAYHLEKAKKSKKRIEFLETMEFQTKLFYNFGMAGDDYVLQAIKDLDDLKEIVPSLIAQWRNGTSQITDTAEKEMREKFPNLYKTIIADRNKNWLVLIEDYLATKDVEFIIVGLAHLHGSNGLLKSLKEKGYKIEYLK